ncbi:hypothetical protein CANCADRAFT_138606 [Tortispora caseinolytica NRRL Y-17796]|uniref:Pentacotripeptide-repeat region of PRORP domain-containing protein n=1 Tax=Tortispora caseinolytica NRRL Y-17796 TaxID=767744 RepID=A0A1E4TC61_9ASCO|nr:hypothetical protein CANCADRAFT_138606 [Tortispora caseinolytica NRRL Y-17796]
MVFRISPLTRPAAYVKAFFVTTGQTYTPSFFVSSAVLRRQQGVPSDALVLKGFHTSVGAESANDPEFGSSSAQCLFVCAPYNVQVSSFDDEKKTADAPTRTSNTCNVTGSKPLLRRSFSTSSLDSNLKTETHQPELEAPILISSDRAAQQHVADHEILTDLKGRFRKNAALVNHTPMVSVRSMTVGNKRLSVYARRETAQFISSCSSSSLADRITHLSSNRKFTEAFYTFQEAEKNAPNILSKSVYSATLRCLADALKNNYASPDDIIVVYTGMISKQIVPDVADYSVVISSLCYSFFQAQSELQTLNTIRSWNDGKLLPAYKYRYNFLRKNDSLSSALDVFFATYHVRTPTYHVSLYNDLIRACAHIGYVDEALKVLKHMEQSNVSYNADTFISLMRLYSVADMPDMVEEVFKEYKSYSPSLSELKEVEVYCELVASYFRAGKPDLGLAFVEKFLEQRTLTKEYFPLFDELITGFASLDMLDSAWKWVEQYNNNALGLNASPRSLSTIISAACASGDLDFAAKVVSTLKDYEVSDNLVFGGALEMFLNKAILADDLPKVKLGLEALRASSAGLDAISLGNLAVYYLSDSSRGSLDEINVAVVTTRDSKAAFIDSILSIYSRLSSSEGGVSPDSLKEIMKLGIANTRIADELLRSSDPSDWMKIMLEYFKDVVAVDESSFRGITGYRLRCFLRMLVNLAGRLKGVYTQRKPNNFSVKFVDGPSPAKLSLARDDRRELLNFLTNYAPGIVALAQEEYGLSNATSDTVVKEALAEVTALVELIGASELKQEWKDYISLPNKQLLEAGFDVNKSNTILNMLSPPFNVPDEKLMSIIENADPFKNKLSGSVFALAIIHLCVRRRKMNYFDRIMTSAIKHLGAPQVEDELSRRNWGSVYDACLRLNSSSLENAQHYKNRLKEFGVTLSADAYAGYLTVLCSGEFSSQDVLNIFQEAKDNGIIPNQYMYNVGISRLAKIRRFIDAKALFDEMTSHNIPKSAMTWGSIINGALRDNKEDIAERLYDEYKGEDCFSPHCATINAFLQHYLQTGNVQKFLEHYEEFTNYGVPKSSHTYVLQMSFYSSIMKSQSDVLNSLIEMRANGIEPGDAHYGAVIRAYGIYGNDLESMEKFVRELPQGFSVRDNVAQAIVESYGHHGKIEPILELFRNREASGLSPTPYLYSALIRAYGIAGDLENAEKVFKETALDKREPTTYESMLRVYLHFGKVEEANAIVRDLCKRAEYSMPLNRELKNMVSRYDIVKGDPELLEEFTKPEFLEDYLFREY